MKVFEGGGMPHLQAIKKASFEEAVYAISLDNATT